MESEEATFEVLAQKAFEFYFKTQDLYVLLVDGNKCNDKVCSTMTIMAKYQQLIPDSESAPSYIGNTFAWIESQLNNNYVFPETEDVPFPENFLYIVHEIFTELFRIHEHILFQHLDCLPDINLDEEFNTQFIALYKFVRDFELLSEDELQPFNEILNSI